MDKNLELESLKKELSVKTKMMLQAKSDSSSLKQGVNDSIKTKMEIDRLNNTISALKHEVETLNARTKELDLEHELKDNTLDKLNEKNELISKRLRSLITDQHLDRLQNKELINKIQSNFNHKLSLNNEKVKQIIQEKLNVKQQHQKLIEEKQDQHQESIDKLKQEKERELNSLRGKVMEHSA